MLIVRQSFSERRPSLLIAVFVSVHLLYCARVIAFELCRGHTDVVCTGSACRGERYVPRLICRGGSTDCGCERDAGRGFARSAEKPAPAQSSAFCIGHVCLPLIS